MFIVALAAVIREEIRDGDGHRQDAEARALSRIFRGVGLSRETAKAVEWSQHAIFALRGILVESAENAEHLLEWFRVW